MALSDFSWFVPIDFGPPHRWHFPEFEYFTVVSKRFHLTSCKQNCGWILPATTLYSYEHAYESDLGRSGFTRCLCKRSSSPSSRKETILRIRHFPFYCIDFILTFFSFLRSVPVISHLLRCKVFWQQSLTPVRFRLGLERDRGFYLQPWGNMMFELNV